MTARTVTVRRALAQATVRAGRIHVAAQQDTGTWIGVCGRQVRSREITTWDGASALEHAEQHASALCEDCAANAIAVGGALAAGVAMLLHLDDAAPASVARLELVPLARITVPAGRPRRADGETLERLAASIAAHGVLQPLVVRPAGAGFELVIGSRRLAAARAAGLASVPAVVRDVDDEQAVVDALVENLHRADLNPIEQAHAYARALAVLGGTKEALAARLQISRAQVSNTIRLLALPEQLREQVAAGALTAAHGRALLRVTDPAEQAALAERIVGEDLTTRDADAAARRTAASRPRPDVALADVAALLTGLLDARVLITSTAQRARVVIDVPEADLPRILEQLGASAVAA